MITNMLKNQEQPIENRFKSRRTHYFKVGIGKCMPNNIKTHLKLAGIIFALGYLITILAIWIYQTGFQSYTWISLGEPNLYIKYFEWVLGIIAIVYLISEGKRTLDTMKAVSYDPFV